MWTLRILNGPLAGKSFPLKEGKNKIGRAATCDIQVSANGVSKEHLEISLMGDKIIFTDLNSSNGTYLNGVKVNGGVLKTGDKFSVHDVLMDLVFAAPRAEKKPATLPPRPAPLQRLPPRPPAHHQQQYAQPQYNQFQQQQPQAAPPPPTPPQGLKEKFEAFLNRVVLPSVYALVEQFEFKTVLSGFVGFYVLMVTFLSVVPMNQITNESISIESRRRAMTVARALAQMNERVIRSGDLSQFSTDFVMKEEGIDDVYIVSKDGRIIAPPARVGNVPKEVAFYKMYKEQVRDLSAPVGKYIGAAVPILAYDAEAQKNVAKAFAVVIYNPSSMTFDDGRAISLFVQMLVIATLIGTVLFFFLNKLIEYPYKQIAKVFDEALRSEGVVQATLTVRLPILQNMLVNLNTVLSRVKNTGQTNAGPVAAAGSKNAEYFNILHLIGFPALFISGEGVIKKANSAFEAVTNINPNHIENQKIDMLPDQAMQKNITELMAQASANPGQTAADKLEIGGQMFNLCCQAMTTASGEIDCYFLTISPLAASEGSAA
jgi:hypothetical protein